MAKASNKKRLIQRLQWYYPMERLNALLFLGITFLINYLFGPENSIYLTYSILLMVFILFQGTYYWRLKLYSIQGLEVNQKAASLLFKKLKRANVLLIFFSPLVVILQWWFGGQTLANSRPGWALLANAFAILEHINYYHTQLMYDNLRDLKYLLVNKRLKTASLKKDLVENKF